MSNTVKAWEVAVVEDEARVETLEAELDWAKADLNKARRQLELHKAALVKKNKGGLRFKECRHKPVPFTAYQIKDTDRIKLVASSDYAEVQTKEGERIRFDTTVHVYTGDYILNDPYGNDYHCNEHLFNERYELIKK